MATVTVNLTQGEITEALLDYVRSRMGLKAKKASVTASPAYDAMDRPMGTYTVSASVECEGPTTPSTGGKG